MRSWEPWCFRLIDNFRFRFRFLWWWVRRLFRLIEKEKRGVEIRIFRLRWNFGFLWRWPQKRFGVCLGVVRQNNRIIGVIFRLIWSSRSLWWWAHWSCMLVREYERNIGVCFRLVVRFSLWQQFSFPLSGLCFCLALSFSFVIIRRAVFALTKDPQMISTILVSENVPGRWHRWSMLSFWNAKDVQVWFGGDSLSSGARVQQLLFSHNLGKQICIVSRGRWITRLPETWFQTSLQVLLTIVGLGVVVVPLHSTSRQVVDIVKVVVAIHGGQPVGTVDSLFQEWLSLKKNVFVRWWNEQPNHRPIRGVRGVCTCERKLPLRTWHVHPTFLLSTF